MVNSWLGKISLPKENGIQKSEMSLTEKVLVQNKLFLTTVRSFYWYWLPVQTEVLRLKWLHIQSFYIKGRLNVLMFWSLGSN